MEYLKTILYFVAVLSVLVIAHEWGHFIVARLCGMHVEDFSLFFGKKLITLGVRNGTEYNIRSIPLGGFVRIAGFEPEDISNGAPIFRAMASSRQKILQGLDDSALGPINFDQVSPKIIEAVDNAVSEEGRLTVDGRTELEILKLAEDRTEAEQLYLQLVLQATPQEVDPNGYNQKPIWQRALVIFAGPFMSLFFGYILFCVMGVTTGIPEIDESKADNVVMSIVKGKPADLAGIRPDDRIVSINNTPVTDGRMMTDRIHSSANIPLHLTVERGKKQLQVTVTPLLTEVVDHENGKAVKKQVGLIGISPREVLIWKRLTPTAAVQRGTLITQRQVVAIVQGIFSKNVKDNVGGIITIGKQIHEDSKAGLRQVLLTSALLSLSLGIFNLLPIPILDGGHLMLLAWEFVRRRRLSSMEVYRAQMVGLSIILVMFVFVMYNDVLKLFPAK